MAEIRRTLVFADYYQFYIQDAAAHDQEMRSGGATNPDRPPAGWTEESEQIRIGVEPHSVSVGTARRDVVENHPRGTRSSAGGNQRRRAHCRDRHAHTYRTRVSTRLPGRSRARAPPPGNRRSLQGTHLVHSLGATDGRCGNLRTWRPLHLRNRHVAQQRTQAASHHPARPSPVGRLSKDPYRRTPANPWQPTVRLRRPVAAVATPSTVLTNAFSLVKEWARLGSNQRLPACKVWSSARN